MSKLEKISSLEAIFLIITIIVNQIIFNLPNIILHSCGTSAWINVIFVGILAIVFTFIISKIFSNFPYQDIVDIAGFLGGGFLKTLIGVFFILFFFIFNVLCIGYFANALKLIYFNKTPLMFLILLFILPPILLNKYSFKTIANVNMVFVPFVVLDIIILFLGSSNEFDISNIFPLLGFGVKETFLYSITNLFAFSGLAYLFFINPFLKEKEFKRVSIISIVISAVYLLGSIICLLLSFSSVTQYDQLFSLYALTRRITLGTFLQRVDALFILIWILNNFCFTSIGIFYISHIFQKLTKIEDSKQILYFLTMLTFSACLVFNNIADIKRFALYFYKYFSFPLIFIASFLILIIANIKYRNKKQV